MTTSKGIPSISVSYARTRRSIRSNELGMRPMQERAWEKHGAGSSEDWSRHSCATVSRAARAGPGLPVTARSVASRQPTADSRRGLLGPVGSAWGGGPQPFHGR